MLRTLNYGNYGIFLIMGHAGFESSTAEVPSFLVHEADVEELSHSSLGI